MPTFLLNKWLIGGLVIAGLGLGLYLQTQRLEASKKAEKAALQRAAQWESNYRTAQQINADNLKALDALKARQAEADKALTDQLAKYDRLGVAFERIKRDAYSDKTPLSPSWTALVNSLQSVTEASARGNNQDSGGAPLNP